MIQTLRSNKNHGRFHKMQKESTWFLVVSDSINHLDNELVLLTGCDVVM